MAHDKDPSQQHPDEQAGDDSVPDSEGTVKPGGLGDDGTIPAAPDGVAAGHSDSESHFNAEEDGADS